MFISIFSLLHHLRIEEYELMYSWSLLTSLILAYKIPSISTNYQKRSLYCTIIGFSTILILSGVYIYHFLICSFVSFYITHNLFKFYRRCTLAVLIFSFCYIGVIRYLYYIDKLLLTDTTNICFLMLVFKLINYAYTFEFNDRSNNQPSKTLTNFIHYIFFFPGIWCGPYMSYTTVYECLNNPKTIECDYKHYLLKRTKQMFPYVLIFKFLSLIISLKDPFTQGFQNFPFVIKLFIISIILFYIRTRYITAWYISEMTCIISGVAYDPLKKNNINNQVVFTVDPWNINFATSIKTIGRYWNCTVQTWLFTTIYKRINLKWKFLNKIAVLIISAFWHGIETGYFVSFLLFGLAQASQDLIWEKNWPLQNNKWISILYTIMKLISTQILLIFCTIPFIFKQDYWYLWKEMNYIGLYICTIIIFIFIISHLYQVSRTFKNKYQKLKFN